MPKSPKKIILDVDDTNADTYGNQQLTLFNDYYGEYCYMPLLVYRAIAEGQFSRYCVRNAATSH